jgi:uncharacterized Zn finger protein
VRDDGGRWDDGYPPPAPPKLPPPAHGIQARRLGTTWWARRWIAALERLGAAYFARLRRGKSYARQGRVHDLAVKEGAVRARVTGTRPKPYDVTMRLAPLADQIWDNVTRAMAAKALFAAKLLAGEMPHGIDDVFRSCGWSLFPEKTHDLITSCTCPDWANPCKHVAALHYVLAEFLDRDPFLLFELRGRSKDAVIEALRRVRSMTPAAGRARRRQPAGAAAAAGTAAAPTAGTAPAAPAASERADGVRLATVSREPYDVFRESVADLRFRIEPPPVEGAVLRQLGAPASWRLQPSPRDTLQPAVSRAAALARDLALGTPDPEGPARTAAGAPPGAGRGGAPPARGDRSPDATAGS